MHEYIAEYHNKIVGGEIVVGKWVRMLYDRVTDRVADGTYVIDTEKERRAVNFISSFLHHNKGRNDLVKLELWQKALISLIFAVVWPDTGRRVFQEVFAVMARKQGKSLLVSGIVEYELYVDGGYGTDIYIVAPKLDQAEIVYQDTIQSIQQEPDLMAITKQKRDGVHVEKTNSFIKKLAFNAKKADGFDPQLTVCDEIAAWPGESGIRQYEVMTSAIGARKEPLIISITTANYAQAGIFQDLMARATKVLLGHSEETAFLPVLYMIDDIQKWDDVEELRKSMPNLGISVSETSVQTMISKAHSTLKEKAEFLTKQCCIEQTSSSAWLSTETIGKCFSDRDLFLRDFHEHYCVGGIDLSKSTDLTSCCVVIQHNGALYIFSQFFLPAQKIAEATERDNLPYDTYIKRGLLTISGQNAVDYMDCFKWFKMLVEKYHIYPLEIGYDRWMALPLVQQMTQYGFHMDDVWQGFNLSPVLTEMEGLFKDGQVHCGANDLLKVHMYNSALKMDKDSGKCKLVKLSASQHIDGMAALSDAFTVRQKWWSQYGPQLENADRQSGIEG